MAYKNTTFSRHKAIFSERIYLESISFASNFEYTSSDVYSGSIKY
jgi:hypothetical protein